MSNNETSLFLQTTGATESSIIFTGLFIYIEVDMVNLVSAYNTKR